MGGAVRRDRTVAAAGMQGDHQVAGLTRVLRRNAHPVPFCAQHPRPAQGTDPVAAPRSGGGGADNENLHVPPGSCPFADFADPAPVRDPVWPCIQRAQVRKPEKISRRSGVKKLRQVLRMVRGGVIQAPPRSTLRSPKHHEENSL